MKRNCKAKSAQKTKVFIGIDVSRQKYAVCCYKGAEEIPYRFVTDANAKGLVTALKRKYRNNELFSVYEASYCGFELHRYLKGKGISNIVINPGSLAVQVRDKVKTDPRDAKKLAEQLRANMLRGIRIPSLEEETARQLPRTREQLLGQRRRTMVRVRMKLHQFNLLAKEHKGVLSLRAVKKLIQEGVPTELEQSIELLLKEWESLNQLISQANRYILAQAKKDPLDEIYRSIPGVGIQTARILSTELGDMSQFPNERQLVGFVGLHPSQDTTAFNPHYGHITRQGSARLRQILTEAAWRAVKSDAKLKAVFERLASRRNSKKIAIVAVARKMLIIARACLKNRTCYGKNINQVEEEETKQRLAA